MPILSIYTSCWADPFAVISTSDALKLYEYSPLVIEASILNDEKSVRKSTEQIKKKLQRQKEKKDIDKTLKPFLEKRSSFLSQLRSVPEVESFVRFTIDKAEEVRKSQEEVREFLAGIGAIKELRKELSREIRVQFKRRSFLIDATRKAILTGNVDLKKSLVEYVRNFNEELRRLVIERAMSETIYTILAADVLIIAEEKQNLRTAKTLAIPLDLSPLRLSLAMLKENQRFYQSRIYYPPLFLLYNPEASAINLARPYRTIDGHPVFIRAPKFEADKIAAQRDTSDARKNFEQKVGPLLYALKGLAGTSETTPSLITEPLIQVIFAYLSFNPLSKDLLKIIDLGCGSGALLKKIFTKVIDKGPLDETITVSALLNDDSQKDPGKSFRSLSLQEPYATLFDARVWRGDLRKLVIELDSLDERFDIAFINRVLDMYGGYGIFEFQFRPKKMNGGCSSCTERKKPIEPNVGDVLAFTESIAHEDAWRAIKYIFDRQARKKEEGMYLLPSIDMKMRKNFFGFEGLDIFERLLALSKLLVVSIFPGDFKTLFPEVKSIKDKIYYCQKTSSISYSELCISKSKELIEHIKAQCPDFLTN